jgi:hypothetical protein
MTSEQSYGEWQEDKENDNKMTDWNVVTRARCYIRLYQGQQEALVRINWLIMALLS